jgi:glycosyltransferase involved in cell wall biosynthesis
MPNFLVFAAIMPRLFGKPLILDIHDSVPETFEGKFSKPSPLLFKLFCLEERICCALAQRLICVNDVQRDALVKRGIPEGKIAVILNVPDHHILNERGNRRAESHRKDTFDLLYHGTIHRMQGLDLVIDAMPRLLDGSRVASAHHRHRSLPGFTGAAGEEPERGGSRALQHEGLPLNEILVILETKDLGIVPNRRSAATEIMLPVKLLEYATVGLPTVVPSLKTIRHYFSQEMVAYFEPENQDSMVDAITGLYRSEHRRSEQARRAKEFMTRYGWERHQLELVRLYDSLH